MKTKGYKINLYHGKALRIKIPSKYNEEPITVIGNGAFSNYGSWSKIKSVKIPNSVVKIEEYAFMKTT